MLGQPCSRTCKEITPRYPLGTWEFGRTQKLEQPCSKTWVRNPITRPLNSWKLMSKLFSMAAPKYWGNRVRRLARKSLPETHWGLGSMAASKSWDSRVERFGVRNSITRSLKSWKLMSKLFSMAVPKCWGSRVWRLTRKSLLETRWGLGSMAAPKSWGSRI